MTMQTIFFKHPNLDAHVERIEGLILREGESVSRVPGSEVAILLVHDPDRTQLEMLDEGWDEEDFA